MRSAGRHQGPDAHPQQRFLHHVLGLGHAAEHPVGDRERDRQQLVKQSLAIGHAKASLAAASRPNALGPQSAATHSPGSLRDRAARPTLTKTRDVQYA
jgi:hypothetical protein